MINNISFTNYKSFKAEQTLELKPITIIIGKNSSGKSAIAKLPVFIENSLHNVMDEPYTLEYNDVQFGGDYRDVFFERIPNAVLEFKIVSDSGDTLIVKIVSDFEKNTIPTIISWQYNRTTNLIYNPADGKYTNLVDKKVYKINFDGFEPSTVIDENGEEVSLYVPTGNLRSKTDYIGPFRVYANTMRTFQVRSLRNITSVGVNGEDAYTILGVESLKSKSDLIESVSNWYKENFDGWGIHVNSDLQPHYSIELTREDRKFNVNIADVGQGMSQALPLIVSAFLPNSEQLTIIEQPELHLHPAAHGNLAELFAKSAINFNKKYLIETHSQNFVLRLRRLIAEGEFSSSDLRIYWVDYDGESNSSSLKTIEVNEFGEVEFWPPNIFSETLDETLAMRTAQNQRKNAN